MWCRFGVSAGSCHNMSFCSVFSQLCWSSVAALAGPVMDIFLAFAQFVIEVDVACAGAPAGYEQLDEKLAGSSPDANVPIEWGRILTEEDFSRIKELRHQYAAASLCSTLQPFNCTWISRLHCPHWRLKSCVTQKSFEKVPGIMPLYGLASN